MKYSIKILFLLSLSALAWAQKNAVPSCHPIAVRGESVVLSTKKPVLIVLHNLSTSNLWITHPVKSTGAEAGWSSQLDTRKWSALLLDKDKFELTCIESRPGHEQQIPCEGMIAVCEWKSVKITAKELGTYWAAENRTWSDLISYLGGRGFSLPGLDNK